jgi:hypothetical protein
MEWKLTQKAIVLKRSLNSYFQGGTSLISYNKPCLSETEEEASESLLNLPDPGQHFLTLGVTLNFGQMYLITQTPVKLWLVGAKLHRCVLHSKHACMPHAMP